MSAKALKIMKSNVTTVARKIAKAHNARIAAGFGGNGKLVFGRDGGGGAWYSEGSYGFGADALVVGMRHGRITAAQAQEIVDNAAKK